MSLIKSFNYNRLSHWRRIRKRVLEHGGVDGRDNPRIKSGDGHDETFPNHTVNSDYHKEFVRVGRDDSLLGVNEREPQQSGGLGRGAMLGRRSTPTFGGRPWLRRNAR
jgi:hypothetical protein